MNMYKLSIKTKLNNNHFHMLVMKTVLVWMHITDLQQVQILLYFIIPKKFTDEHYLQKSYNNLLKLKNNLSRTFCTMLLWSCVCCLTLTFLCSSPKSPSAKLLSSSSTLNVFTSHWNSLFLLIIVLLTPSKN